MFLHVACVFVCVVFSLFDGVSVAQAQGERAAGYSPAAGEGVLLVSGSDAAAVALSAHDGQAADRGRAQGNTA